MSYKLKEYKNTNSKSLAFGKWYVRPVYDKKPVTTVQLADFIQTQCTVKRSDCKAVLDELGAAFKHFFDLGQHIQLDGIGSFKVGVKSTGVATREACGAGSVRQAHVIFQPETESVKTGRTAEVQSAVVKDGAAVLVTRSIPTFSRHAVMLKDVEFEMLQDKNID